MKGWILFDYNDEALQSEQKEIERFLETAKKNDIEIKVFEPHHFDLMVIRETQDTILVDDKQTSLPDFFLPRTGASTTYYSLAIIRHMERMRVPTFNSAQSIETVKDKLFTQQILASNNLPIPRTLLVKFPINADMIEENLGFPVIVKTLSGSQGSGVYLSKNKDEFIGLMQLLNATKTNMNIIIQEFIQSSEGRDLRVIVIGGRAVGAMQRIAQEGEFRANISKGGYGKCLTMNSEIEWLAIESAKILGLDIAGIDLLFDGDHFKVCEANSAPGFTGFEKYCKVDIPNEIFNFISVRLGFFDKYYANK
ncbi:MAG: RimK family alpha-L-glutamate ligase [Candidatus Atribacteria bacterium]|nr:RimK family alpha-L-glutamate ligase [Candidatus Atribacteria bacterium]